MMNDPGQEARDNEPGSEFTDIEELATLPLSELVEPQDLDLPQIEAQDLELPQDYLQDLADRGVITEARETIDIDSRLLEGSEREPSPFSEPSIEINETLNEPAIENERDFDFGR